MSVLIGDAGAASIGGVRIAPAQRAL